MIKGIGVDMVDISEIARLIDVFGNNYINHTFTKREVAVSREATNPAEYLATRFAAKEAVFKAIAHLTQKKTFDLRVVETLNESDGFPYISINEELQGLLEDAGVVSLFISITTEGDYATAFVVAE